MGNSANGNGSDIQNIFSHAFSLTVKFTEKGTQFILCFLGIPNTGAPLNLCSMRLTMLYELWVVWNQIFSSLLFLWSRHGLPSFARISGRSTNGSYSCCMEQVLSIIEVFFRWARAVLINLMYLMISKFHKFHCFYGLCYSKHYFILHIEHGDLRFTTQGTMMENPWMYPPERKERNLCGRIKFVNLFTLV
jgi:hypothetical protein